MVVPIVAMGVPSGRWRTRGIPSGRWRTCSGRDVVDSPAERSLQDAAGAQNHMRHNREKRHDEDPFHRFGAMLVPQISEGLRVNHLVRSVHTEACSCAKLSDSNVICQPSEGYMPLAVYPLHSPAEFSATAWTR